MKKVLRDVGAGLAFAVVAGTAIHTADDLTGDNLHDLVVDFEDAIIDSEASAFQNSISRHPGSTLNLAIFVLGVPLGAIGFRKIANNAEKSDKPPSP